MNINKNSPPRGRSGTRLTPGFSTPDSPTHLPAHKLTTVCFGGKGTDSMTGWGPSLTDRIIYCLTATWQAKDSFAMRKHHTKLQQELLVEHSCAPCCTTPTPPWEAADSLRSPSDLPWRLCPLKPEQRCTESSKAVLRKAAVQGLGSASLVFLEIPRVHRKPRKSSSGRCSTLHGQNRSCSLPIGHTPAPLSGISWGVITEASLTCTICSRSDCWKSEKVSGWGKRRIVWF